MFMKLWFSDEEKRIYTEDNATYTLLNMGCYVGHRGRDVNETYPACWKLMFVDKDMFHVNDIHIEALVDETGLYSRLIMKCGWLRRIILFEKNNVIYDVIEDTMGIANKRILGEVYLSKNNDLNKKSVSISEYLNQEVSFVSLNGSFLENNPLTNEEIKLFFSKNEELSNDKIDAKTRIKNK